MKVLLQNILLEILVDFDYRAHTFPHNNMVNGTNDYIEDLDGINLEALFNPTLEAIIASYGNRTSSTPLSTFDDGYSFDDIMHDGAQDDHDVYNSGRLRTRMRCTNHIIFRSS